MTFPAGKPDEGPVAETGELPLEAPEPGESAPETTMPATPGLQEATGEAEPPKDTGPAKRGKGAKPAKPKGTPSNLREFHQKEVAAGRAVNKGFAELWDAMPQRKPMDETPRHPRGS